MAHLTVAASEDAFRDLFAGLRDGFSASASDSSDFGPFSASYSAGVRLEGGTVDLQSGGTVRISELDVVYDPLVVTLGVDIPEICVGGFCIIPSPFGCILRAPRICVFSADPDISLPLDLSGLINSEISGSFEVDVEDFQNPGRIVGMTDLDAEDAGVSNAWRFLLDPEFIDFDLIDFADTVGNVLDAAINNAVDSALGFLPGFLRDLVKAVLGAPVTLIRSILDIGDDIDEWLSNLLGVSFGLFDFVLSLIADHFAKENPIFEFENPFPVLPASGGLIPVKLPIEKVDVQVTDTEMIITADVGA